MRHFRFSYVFVLALAAVFSREAAGQGTFASIDIGAKTPAGQTVITNGGFDVSSATGDIWDIADDFRFVYQQVSGDFDIRTRIAGFTGVGYWAKAGLMVREDLTEFGVNGFMIATRSSGWGRYMFTSRLAQFYATYVYSQGSFERVQYPNTWVRLVRVGNTVIPMHSTNGITWTQIGNLVLTQLPGTAYVGMAVSNHPESGTARATAQFRDISLDAGTPVAPAILTQPYSEIANPGSPVTFSVTAVGRGTLSYQWFRNGTEMSGATNATLAVAAVEENDGAKFTCLVRNDAGETLSWAGLLEVQAGQEPFDGILLERYSRVPGRRVDYMINATNYPSGPAGVSRPALFEISSLGDDTGARLRGYVTAPATGEYTFYIAGDDRGELWLSSDDNPANKRMIAQCYYWVNPRQWDYYQGQVSDPVRLQAGRRYYIEAFIKGDGSPNHGSVGWRLPNGTFERPIPASRFVGQAPMIQQVERTPLRELKFGVAGTANSLYVVQTSTNLSEWAPILTNRVPFEFVESDPGADPNRFYRVVTSR